VPSGASARINVAVVPDGLSLGVYQAALNISAPGAVNNPQGLVVTLQVVSVNTPPAAELSANGILIVTPQGSTAQSRSVVIGNAGAGGLTFQLQASTTSGGNWLSVSPASGNASAGPISVQVSANPAALVPNIYRGRITGAYSAGPAPELEVTLVVTPPVTAITQRAPADPVRADCAASTMDVVATTIGNGLSLPISFPRSIVIQVVDSCGLEVNDATAVAVVPALSIPLPRVGGGTYSASWTPDRALSTLDITLTASHPVYPTVERRYTVSTTVAAGGQTLPTLSQDGVVEGAGFTRLRPLAPGSIISVFGSQFAAELSSAVAVPLSRTLGGTSVLIGGELAPLFFVSPGQINAQVPFNLRPGDNVTVAVSAAGRITAAQSYLVAPNQPGIFQSQGVAAVLDAQFRPVNEQNPAAPGGVLQIFANGLGLVDQNVPSGDASPGFSRTLLPVSVRIGGVSVPVLYQGLAPGFVGLYQVNVQLPPNAPTGNAVPVVIQQAGIISNPELPVAIPIR
jgi:uncharacterized protein (TIGR03437 family)